MSPTIRFPLHKHTLTIKAMTNDEKKLVHSLSSHIKDDDMAKMADSDSDSTVDLNPMTPQILSDLYQMTDSFTDIIGDSDSLDSSVCRQGIASFIEQYYDDTDLSLFWQDLAVSPQASMERYPLTQPDGFGSEAELDTQYITSTGKGIYTYVYYIDSDDIFVSLAEAILDTDIPPLVVSISYGADEYELGEDWVTRCNTEFGKLALIGTTVLASSGDSGALGNDEDCLIDDDSISDTSDNDKSGKSGNSKTGKSGKRRMFDKNTPIKAKGTSNKNGGSSSSSTDYSFIASFPASAPYVTSVGGTTGGSAQTSADYNTGEEAWLYSGGGFSMYFDAPDWQTNAINSYLNDADITLPDSARYTSTGRAYPDISAQSVDYVIAYDQEFYLVSGTSASSPTVAGMISMINYARIQSGKSSLGFLNPTLYSLYDDDKDYYFNDVTTGYNLGCSVDDNTGFYAASGWDPITGVGTPKFSRLYEALLNSD
eukprot:429118_1